MILALEPGFSLMAGMDLELDSEDEALPAAQPAVPIEPVYSAPIATLPSTQLDSSLPPIFSLWGVGVKPEDRGKTLLNGEEITAFSRCETDEQMEAAWREQKVGLTREFKRRHREAVKRQKRGMGLAEVGDE